MPKKLRVIKWSPELSIRFWQDLAGSDYLAQIAFSKFAAPYLVDLAIPYLGGTRGKVLDFGAGENLYLVKELIARGFDVSFVEPNAVKTAHRHGNGHRVRARRYQQDRLPTRFFDAAFFSEVIEHLDDQAIAGAFRAIRSSMKRNGRLVVTTPENEDLTLASRYCPKCRKLFHPWGHVRSFTAQTLEATLASFGFRCDALHSVDFSNAREPIEQLKRLQHELFEVQKTIEMLLTPPNNHPKRSGPWAKDAAMSHALGEELKALLTRVSSAARQRDTEDPKRRRIGAGGTLVAIAHIQGLR